MYLPDYVRVCVDALEEAGFQAWAVGGCVRDAILGLTPNDYDLCTDARPDQTEEVFAGYGLILNGKKHGTVGVIVDKNVVEITTFRTEGDYRDNRHPEWVEFVPDIKQDLARRDYTVNAMAWSPKRGFADPFGGREDLSNHVLRAVGDPEKRFREDSLRILRGARFAVKYRLEPEAATEKAMTALAPLMDNLARERVWDELCKLILLADASDLLRFAPVVTQVIPELRPLMGFDQKNKHHIYDIYTHTARVVQGVPRELTLRWAALLHDIGKPASFTLGDDGQGHFYGHAAVSAEMADGVLRRLKAPTALRERVVLLIEKHMVWLEVSKSAIRRWISRLGPEAMDQLMTLQSADTGGKGTEDPAENPYFSGIRAIMDQIEAENACLTLKDLAVNGHDLMALGLKGREIGNALNRLLSLVLEDAVPNEKAALLAALQEDTI
ncbi:MAG: CCA tRNA nucleotidyltransferase [Ruminococcaceae bacterium]|nr:CCA tRNA nucleotidyltransferase [Oscillospiraceae bacterium]